MRVFGPNELLEDVQKKDLCIGCGACVDLCPYFRNHRGKTSMLFPCALSQGTCYTGCPKAEVDLGELASKFWGEPYQGSALGKHSRFLAARAGKKMGRGPFQGGGTVSALIAFSLQKGLIEAAALTGREGILPVPKLVSDPDEIVGCATSKFMAAPTLSALNRGMKEGYSRLGVVGTPCQVTAVAKMRSNPLEKDDFSDPVSLVIGLFCNWALDTRGFTAFLADSMDVSGIKGMDIPPPPAQVMVIDNGEDKVEIPLEEIRPFIPDTCLICPDMTSEWADVSVGMLEGRPGWNILIVRTNTGAELVRGAEEEGLLITEPISEEYVEHLTGAAANKKKKAITAARDRGLLNTKEDEARAVFRIPDEVVDSILG